MKTFLMSKTVDAILSGMLTAVTRLEQLAQWLDEEAQKREDEIKAAQAKLAEHRKERARSVHVAAKLKELLT